MTNGDLVENMLETKYIFVNDILNIVDNEIQHTNDFSKFSKNIVDISDIMPDLIELLKMLKIEDMNKFDDIGIKLLIDMLYDISSILDEGEDAIDSMDIIYELGTCISKNMFTYTCFGFDKVDSNPAVNEDFIDTVINIAYKFNIVRNKYLLNKDFNFSYIGKKIISINKSRAMITLITI